MIKYFVLSIVFLLGSAAHAYPDFISYGYTTCISCHYNSHGYGPLTDYGRALFSQEVAARNFWTPKKESDEELAGKSQFIPGVDLPFFLRPAIKYRGLTVTQDPGTQHSVKQWINMQRDFDLVLAADQDQRTVLVVNYGLLPMSQDYYNNGKPVTGVSREHYIRFFPTKKLLIAAGLMDIAYGLRTGDHTSLARDTLGFGKDDQVHGVMAQWFEDKWDLTVHGFVGNLLRDVSSRRKGGAITAETEVAELNRLGFSIDSDSTDTQKRQRAAIHDRLGFPNAKGTSLMFELGYKSDQVTGLDAQAGGYGLVQTIFRLTRGYNLISEFERSQSDFSSHAQEQERWTFGFLLFPLQRVELRLTTVQQKGYSPDTASPDITQLQGQLHVSL